MSRMESFQSPAPASPQESLRSQLLLLRFAPAEEQAFREAHEAEAVVSRLILLGMSLLLIGLTPLYDISLLHMPEAMTLPARLAQFGLQIPALLLALVCVLRPKLRRWSTAAMIFAALAVAAGLEGQRVIAARYDFHVPHVYVVLVMTALLVAGGLRLMQVLPWALLAMVAYTVVEVRHFGSSPAVIYDCISTWMLFVLAVTGAWFREYAERRSWYQQHQLEYQALHDWLTALPNRRCFETRLRELVAKASDEARPLTLLLLDLDGFKPYNDRYGYPAGDEVLRRVAGEIQRRNQRLEDFCARIGGEEFAILWLDLPPIEAQARAELIRQSVGEMGIPNEAMLRGGIVSASAGMAQLEVLADDPDPKRLAARLARRAEEALHDAKAEGRDRLVDAGHFS